MRCSILSKRFQKKHQLSNDDDGELIWILGEKTFFKFITKYMKYFGKDMNIIHQITYSEIIQVQLQKLERKSRRSLMVVWWLLTNPSLRSRWHFRQVLFLQGPRCLVFFLKEKRKYIFIIILKNQLINYRSYEPK